MTSSRSKPKLVRVPPANEELVRLDDLVLGSFHLRNSYVLCVWSEERKKWQLTVPYKNQCGYKMKYFDTAVEAMAEAQKLRDKGY